MVRLSPLPRATGQAAAMRVCACSVQIVDTGCSAQPIETALSQPAAAHCEHVAASPVSSQARECASAILNASLVGPPCAALAPEDPSP